MSDASASLSPTRAVLFVDDEIKVLQGLERMLRPLRHEWTMAFASSGAEALAILETSAFDVLVTDMRMPQMNGAGADGAGCSAPSRRDPDRAVRTRGTRGRDQGRPPRASVPEQAVRRRPHQEQTRAGDAASPIDGISAPSQAALCRHALRTMPAVYIELTAELQSANASVARVATSSRRDPALTAKLLQLINSAYFGLQVYVSDPTGPYNCLGSKPCAPSCCRHMSIASSSGPGGIDPADVWQHGLRTARTPRPSPCP